MPEALDLLRAQAAQGEFALRVNLHDPPRGRLLASAGGFSLQAARHLHENDRDGLAFLIRYNLRPPLSLARLSELPSGKVLLRPKPRLGAQRTTLARMRLKGSVKARICSERGEWLYYPPDGSVPSSSPPQVAAEEIPDPNDTSSLRGAV